MVMKTFLRKLMLSFLAMLCGWIACNIAFWIGAVPSLATESPSIRDVIAIAIYTGIVIFAFWLVIFLPVDLIVPARSRFRMPGTAATCGFIVTFVLVAAIFIQWKWVEFASNGTFTWTLDGFVGALPYVLGTLATGAVAALARSLMAKPAPLA